MANWASAGSVELPGEVRTIILSIPHGRDRAGLNGGLVMNIIRYANEEPRPAVPYFQGLDKIKYDEELLELATRPLVARQAKPDRSSRSSTRTAMQSSSRRLVKKKAQGQKIEILPAAELAAD